VHSHVVTAVAPSITPFADTTWKELVQSGPRPAAYVFTTTYCSTCPDAFDKLHAYVKKTGRKVELAAVVMDVSAEQAMPHIRHFAGATKFYAFDGFEPAIRQSVDPKWPNITPYIVMLSRDGSLEKTIGPPDEAMMKRWLE
jgi:thiol-disulfide isomerase/thioredoxin